MCKQALYVHDRVNIHDISGKMAKHKQYDFFQKEIMIGKKYQLEDSKLNLQNANIPYFAK